MWNIRSPNYKKSSIHVTVKASEKDEIKRWHVRCAGRAIRWRIRGEFKASKELNQLWELRSKDGEKTSWRLKGDFEGNVAVRRAWQLIKSSGKKCAWRLRCLLVQEKPIGQQWELLVPAEGHKASWRFKVKKAAAELYVENVVTQYIHRGRRMQLTPKSIEFSFIIRQILKERALQAFSFLPREAQAPEQGLLFSFVLREGQKPEQGLLFSFLSREAEKTEQGMLFSFLLRDVQTPQRGMTFSFLPRTAEKTEQGQTFSFVFRELGENQEGINFSFLIREIESFGELIDFSFLIRSLGPWGVMKLLEKNGELRKNCDIKMLTQQKTLTAQQDFDLKKVSADFWISHDVQFDAEAVIDTFYGEAIEFTPTERENAQEVFTELVKFQELGEAADGKQLKKCRLAVQRDEEYPIVRIDDNRQMEWEQIVVSEKQNSDVQAHQNLFMKKMSGSMEKMHSDANMNLKLQSKAMIYLASKVFLVRECVHRALVEHDTKRLGKVNLIHREHDTAVQKDDRPKSVAVEEKEHFAIKEGEMRKSDPQSKFAKAMQEISEAAKVLKFIRQVKWYTLHEGEKNLQRESWKAALLENDSIEGVKYKPYSLLREMVQIWCQKVSFKELTKEAEGRTAIKVKWLRELKLMAGKCLGRIMKQESLSIAKEVPGENAKIHSLANKVSHESVYSQAEPQALIGSHVDRLETERFCCEQTAEVYAKQEITVRMEEERKAELICRFWTVLLRDFKDAIILPEIDYPYGDEPLLFGGEQKNNANFSSVFPDEFYKVVDRHPIAAGNDIGMEERPTEIAVMVDMINILIMMWFKYVSAFWGWTGTQAVTGITTSLYEYMNLETSRHKQFENDLYHDYSRVFRWIRWEAEKVALLARNDMELRGNYYVGILIEELIDYMLDHHFDVMPIFEDVNKMDEWRSLFDRPVESDISWVLDKVKGIRHKKLGGKR